MTPAERQREADERRKAFVDAAVARAPRPTDEQARALVVLLNRGLARAEARRRATEAAS